MTMTLRAEEVARAYDRIAGRFAAWAATQDAVRAAIILGSRAREDHAADEWADLDILVLARADSEHVMEPRWVEEIGEAWITFVEPTPDGSGLERRVLFAGGLDVDFAFLAVDAAERLLGADPRVADAAFGRGFRILLDKDGLAARLLQLARPAAAPTTAPDARAFHEAVSDFWYHAVWTAKHLRRGELWWAKGSCDIHLKELLRRVLEWHAAAGGRDPWFRGRFMEEWADPSTISGLRAAFARYDEDDVWRALFATMDLFADLSQRTAAVLGLPYPALEEQRSRALVEEMSSARPGRPS
jgi:aminoglycoside 6-adenylyltransferase